MCAVEQTQRNGGMAQALEDASLAAGRFVCLACFSNRYVVIESNFQLDIFELPAHSCCDLRLARSYTATAPGNVDV
jgi:hypothetical protein